MIRDTTTGQDGTILNRWATEIDGTMITELTVDATTHIISYVWVADDHQGAGHATALYRAATAELPILHDAPWHRSDEGNRWAAGVGGPSADTCTCCDHLHTCTECGSETDGSDLCPICAEELHG